MLKWQLKLIKSSQHKEMINSSHKIKYNVFQKDVKKNTKQWNVG